mmetsp:Transcript_8674/g.20209  ORF Transcript_8674/g.20209 Transcript_8674/m.20209 type:complete len:202 (+) Transcript_8674:186-791(+)
MQSQHVYPSWAPSTTRQATLGYPCLLRKHLPPSSVDSRQLLGHFLRRQSVLVLPDGGRGASLRGDLALSPLIQTSLARSASSPGGQSEAQTPRVRCVCAASLRARGPEQSCPHRRQPGCRRTSPTTNDATNHHHCDPGRALADSAHPRYAPSPTSKAWRAAAGSSRAETLVAPGAPTSMSPDDILWSSGLGVWRHGGALPG